MPNHGPLSEKYAAALRQLQAELTANAAAIGAVLDADDEAEAVRAEVGECTRAGDHDAVDGVCVHCGAEFDTDDDEQPPVEPAPRDAGF